MVCIPHYYFSRFLRQVLRLGRTMISTALGALRGSLCLRLAWTCNHSAYQYTLYARNTYPVNKKTAFSLRNTVFAYLELVAHADLPAVDTVIVVVHINITVAIFNVGIPFRCNVVAYTDFIGIDVVTDTDRRKALPPFR